MLLALAVEVLIPITDSDSGPLLIARVVSKYVRNVRDIGPSLPAYSALILPRLDTACNATAAELETTYATAVAQIAPGDCRPICLRQVPRNMGKTLI